MELVAFRWANYDTPLWSNPNRSAGRWHAIGDDPTQYWALHPLGPWAEYVRAHNITDADDLWDIRSRMWAARFELEPGSICAIDFDSAKDYGIEPADLIGDDHGPCQRLAAILRTRFRALIAPSAALPGTSTLVVFGSRVMSPYTLPPPDDELDVPAGLVSEHGGPPPSVLNLVRYRGTPHAGFEAWQNGAPPPVVNPGYALWPTTP